jgi:Family of unknown function (DUF6345)
MLDRLTIYRTEFQDTGVSRLVDLGQRIFELKDNFQLSETNSGRVLRSGQRMVELATASGGVWAADEAQLWNPSIRPDLLKEADALAKANDIIRTRKLLPDLEPPFRFDKPVVGGTYFALRRDRKRENRRLDVQVAYPIMVGDLPLVGGGADFTIILGHQGGIIGFSGTWRQAKPSFEAKVIERRVADEQFRAMTKGMQIDSYDASLAYYAAPSFRGQEFLYPVYVYRATALFGQRRVPLRQIMIPATEFGPPLVFGEPQPPRSKSARPTFLGKEGSKTRRTLAARTPWRPWEAGTSWIGQSGGLPGSQANAQGFVDEWAAAGWHIDFNWGDANAWESDWRRNDDMWVDNADFVFYTGHATMDGWILSNPDDGFLHFNEVGTNPQSPGDLWGQSDLEWAVIAACGPLQDEILANGGGDVLARWDGAFDGMHILMGYGAITFDNTDEGRKLAQYAKGGSTLINAWFRAAKEIQPSTNGEAAPDGPTVYVGAMWVGKNGIDPVNDHAWDFGSVSADPISPSWSAAMWTMC